MRLTVSLRIALLASVAASPAIAAPQSPAITQLAADDAAAGAAAEASEAAAEDAEIVVYGRGETRQVTEISAADIRLTVAGSSPFVTIQKLPGVNFQSADPFGVYEWSTRISIRGFNQNQLGFTLDGVPLGDMSYGNTNGLHISRAIIADNIGTTRVSQGAGALATASSSNLGGTIEFQSRELQEDFGIAANGTYGSQDTIRGYVAIDSGDMGGLRSSVSYAYLDAKKWKGVGTQRSHQVNAKASYDFSDSARLTGFVNFTDRKENDYQDLSLGMIQRLGYDWDNISGNWPLALQIAGIAANRGDVGGFVPRTPRPQLGTVYPAPIQTADDAYYDAGGLRRDWLTGLKLEGNLAETVTASLQGYYHSNRGQGSWFTPYLASPSGNDVSFRTTEYDISRFGFIGNIKAELGAHTVQASVWYESNDLNQARRFYDVTGATVPSTTALTYQANPFFSQWDNAFSTKTLQFSVQDSWAISDSFTVSAGFKGQDVSLRARENIVTGRLALGTIKNEDYFLPQVGALYKIDENNEIFANFTQNQRALIAAATSGPFATTQAGFDAIRANLRPERSTTIEAGYRFTAGPVRGVLAAYYVDFSNRLLATQNGAGIVGNPAVLANVGSVRSLGVEAGLTWQIIQPLTLTASYAYNDSTYRNDVTDVNGAVLQAIAGRTVVDSPRHIGNIELAYDDGQFYARGNANLMSKRFFTYSNDQSVGGRAIVDAKIGYRFASDSRWLDKIAIEASVTNLTDHRYVATIGSNGYGFSDDNQTLLAGSPRQVFVTLRKDF
ncbi:TonB-dependent receptor domain-containing protein [Sandarakinorhabdus sp.]|uniref:TonB-dependent receptor n=1 Tax=Sandarakinorhabdus sp. TaxID=1916663 RepID=UPI00286EA3D6|nr:TonB-dependent receptor [Sandarakinorhabdus sp.]